MALRNIDNVPLTKTKEVVERALVALCRLVNEPTKTVVCKSVILYRIVIVMFTNSVFTNRNVIVTSNFIIEIWYYN